MSKIQVKSLYRFNLINAKIDKDGYDEQGRYFGFMPGERMYCYHAHSLNLDGHVRARSIEEAKMLVAEKLSETFRFLPFDRPI